MRRTIWIGPVLAAVFLLPTPGRADPPATARLDVFADFRIRAESDWDSTRDDGTERDDRDRLRIRARLGARYDPNRYVRLGVRVRTGSDDAQQSGHITVLDFDDNSTGDADVNLDQWYLRGNRGRFQGWVGRNSMPFWKQNDLLWDDDVTPAGVVGGFETGAGGNGTLTLHLGLVSNPAGMKDFVGNMTLGQIVWDKGIGAGGLTVALGSLRMEGVDEATHPAAALLESGNASRDYEIWAGSVQGRLRSRGRTLTLGVDLMHNAEDYPATDPMSPGSPEQFSFDNRDQTDARVLSAQYGGGRDAGEWLAGWYYAHVETLAVHNSYAQDDWVRWGSKNGQIRSSNFEGHEVRFVYNTTGRSNLTARLFLVDAIVGPEDGKRFRLDFNLKI